MLDLNDKYGRQGLQVVFATTLYGFFGNDRNVAPQNEVADDKKYFTEKWHLPFAIAIKTNDEKSKLGWDKTSQRYFVQGIPQVVVVDGHGIIRYVAVGWEPTDEKSLSALLDNLLQQLPKNDK
jgi:hypothetical protein